MPVGGNGVADRFYNNQRERQWGVSPRDRQAVLAAFLACPIVILKSSVKWRIKRNGNSRSRGPGHPCRRQANAGLDKLSKRKRNRRTARSSAHSTRPDGRSSDPAAHRIPALKSSEVYGKSGAERLISQRDQLLQRYSGTGGHRRDHQVLREDDRGRRESRARGRCCQGRQEAEGALLEPIRSYQIVRDRVGQFMENPLQGARAAVSSVLSSLGPVRHGCDGRRDSPGWLSALRRSRRRRAWARMAPR